MRLVRYLIILALLYAGLVAAFETWLGYSQPQSDHHIVISTFDTDGTKHDRVVTMLESDGKEYVAVNHWPRAWWYRTKSNPNIEVTRDGETKPYTAVQVSGAEHDQVQADNPTGLTFRILTGFPPRYFVRLDPRASETES